MYFLGFFGKSEKRYAGMSEAWKFRGVEFWDENMIFSETWASFTVTNLINPSRENSLISKIKLLQGSLLNRSQRKILRAGKLLIRLVHPGFILRFIFDRTAGQIKD
ncbi:hypothetical protein ABH19_04855 [Leptospirillum sp. Group II 'CF-1']|jgi:hypothetical protein|nr:hypothetical protein ABH19_04855 [Leptospirillum sp. Group II 'CF-1']